MSDIPVHKMASYRSFMNVLNPGILRLTCTKELIEAPGFNIIPFTARFLELNKHLGPNMPRLVVELFWVKELCTLYPEGSPIRHRLIGQVLKQLGCLIKPLGPNLLMIGRRIPLCVRYTGRRNWIPRPSKRSEHGKALQSSGLSLEILPRKKKKIWDS